MYINAQMLFDHLQARWDTFRYGRKPQPEDLPLPAFYLKGQSLAANSLFVARTSDLPPSCDVPCLFICHGKRPANLPYHWKGTVFYLENAENDILAVFNYVQQFFDMVDHWAFQMQMLLEKNAEMKEYVRVSMPVFDNGIAITDYTLKILVLCAAVRENGSSRLILNEDMERIPPEISAEFSSIFVESTTARTPFFHKGQQANPEGNNYCINIFIGDTYVGCCVLFDGKKPMLERDFQLFQIFARFIQKAFKKANPHTGNQIVTLKTIFSSLLQSFPVSQDDLALAVQLLHHNMEMIHSRFGCWHCIVLRSANRDKVLPEQYICSTLEEMLPHTAALYYEDSIILFSTIPENETV